LIYSETSKVKTKSVKSQKMTLTSVKRKKW